MGRNGERPPAGILLAGLSAALMLGTAVSLVVAAQPPAGAAASAAANGAVIAATRCAGCHGADGNAAAAPYPKLAGQNPVYLERQLWAFRGGTRPSAVMAGIAAALSGAQMAAVADYYAGQPVRPDPVRDRALAARGERVFAGHPRGGRGPSCAMCHDPAGGGMGVMMMGRGMRGRGMAVGAPNLYGQHAAYLLDQLDRYAAGKRQAPPMGRLAAALDEADRRAVAAYLSGLR